METFTARKEDIAGLPIASHERIEAYPLYMEHKPDREIVALRSFVDDEGARLKQLLSRLDAGHSVSQVSIRRNSRKGPWRRPGSARLTVIYSSQRRHGRSRGRRELVPERRDSCAHREAKPEAALLRAPAETYRLPNVPRRPFFSPCMGALKVAEDADECVRRARGLAGLAVVDLRSDQ